ncbi:MAG: hypothetical protein KC423_05180 [Anaerolineales bacterium]|nr:hypothetical protein [Anaerolineales bacterium]
MTFCRPDSSCQAILETIQTAVLPFMVKTAVSFCLPPLTFPHICRYKSDINGQ